MDPSLVEVQSLVEEGRVEEALQRCRSAASRSEVARLLLPRLELLAGRRSRALKELRKLAGEAEDALTLCRLGELAVAAGAFVLAGKLLRQAVAREPVSPLAWRCLYRFHQRRGEEETAGRVLERMARRLPPSAWLFHERAARAAAGGREEEALALFARAGDAFGLHQRAEIFRRRGEVEQARREEEAALAQDPGYLWARWRRAAERAARGDVAGALVEVERVAPSARRWLREACAVWLERAGQVRQADRLRLEGLPQHLAEIYAARLQAIRTGEVEWHAFRGRERLDRLRVRVLQVPGTLERRGIDGVLEALRRFHRRELPGSRLEVEVVERSFSLGYLEAERAVRHGNRAFLARKLRLPVPGEEEAVLVFLAGDPPWGASRGFGGHGLAVVQGARKDRWLASVTAHELYHAVAGLRHTDGHKAELDPFGLMGWPGVFVDLEEAYLDFRHRCHMASPPGVGEWVEEGREHEQARRWEEARCCYLEAWRRDPLHFWVLGRLARLALRLDRPAEALQWVGRGRRLDRGCELAAWEGELWIKLGRLSQARRAMASSLGFGSSARCHLALGNAWARGARFREALGEFRRAEALEPGDGESRFHQASIHHALGNYATAARLYQACLEEWACWPEVRRRLALLRIQQGREQEAWDHLRAARGLQDRCAEQPYFEGRVAWLAGRPALARRRLLRARALAPDEQPPLYALGWLDFSLGRRRSARYWFRRCRELEAISFLGRAAGAFLEWIEGQGPSALHTARELLRLDRRHSPLIYLLWRDAQDRGLASAASLRTRFEALEPRHPCLRSGEK